MKKRIFSVLLIVVAAQFTLHAEILSKIGIVNFSRIVEDYFAESAAWREIDSMRERYQEGKDEILEEIDELRVKKLEEERQGNEREALRLEDRIYQKQEYLKEFHSVWTNRINAKIETIYQSSTFTAEILDAIEYVAENEGYSIILRSQDPNILWYNREVDITELILERLRWMASRE